MPDRLDAVAAKRARTGPFNRILLSRRGDATERPGDVGGGRAPVEKREDELLVRGAFL